MNGKFSLKQNSPVNQVCSYFFVLAQLTYMEREKYMYVNIQVYRCIYYIFRERHIMSRNRYIHIGVYIDVGIYTYVHICTSDEVENVPHIPTPLYSSSSRLAHSHCPEALRQNHGASYMFANLFITCHFFDSPLLSIPRLQLTCWFWLFFFVLNFKSFEVSYTSKSINGDLFLKQFPLKSEELKQDRRQ